MPDRRDHSFLSVFTLVFAVGLVGSLASGGFAQPPSGSSLDSAVETAISQFDDSALLDDDNLEYMARGPLHEAYAEPYESDPLPTPLVSAEPPDPIDELPPQYSPEGKQVDWIPGYWAWDEELNDFIWVSGVWRDLPPGRRWVAGYWESEADGYRWVNGFWAQREEAEVEYLPAPPESLEQGPSSPAPSDNHFYVPGNWSYQSANYQWTSGYWATGYDNWVWVPNEYVWTPRGCIFRSGYWDYDVARRGLLFAPVYFRTPIYRRANYFYRPWYTIRSGLGLLAQLFVRPRWGHYYFGDYYGRGYANRYQPWIHYGRPGYGGQHRHRYDPLLSYYGRRARHGGYDGLRQVDRHYRAFEDDVRYRPPRTLAAQQRFRETLGRDGVDRDLVKLASSVEPLDERVRGGEKGVRFRELQDGDRQRARDAGQSSRTFAERRREFENNGGRRGPVVDRGRSGRDDRDQRDNVVKRGPATGENGSLGLPPIDGRRANGRQAAAVDEQRETRQRPAVGRDQRATSSVKQSGTNPAAGSAAERPTGDRTQRELGSRGEPDSRRAESPARDQRVESLRRAAEQSERGAGSQGLDQRIESLRRAAEQSGRDRSSQGRDQRTVTPPVGAQQRQGPSVLGRDQRPGRAETPGARTPQPRLQRQIPRPQSAGPPVTKQQAIQPQATRPQATRPQASRPQPTRPQAVQPRTVQPQTRRPQAARPPAVRPSIGNRGPAPQARAAPQPRRPSAPSGSFNRPSRPAPSVNRGGAVNRGGGMNRGGGAGAGAANRGGGGGRPQRGGKK